MDYKSKIKKLVKTYLSGPEDINVVCLFPIYVYKVGKIYRARYLFDKCLIDDNDYVEYEWQVFCAKYNHYQFTEKDFKKYFVDIVKQREEKISSILNI